jgi:hypothetical protein
MENNNVQTPSLSTEQKQELVARWRSSGQRQKAFCQEHNLKYNAFVSWASKSKKGKTRKSKLIQKAKGFTEVKISSPGSSFAEIKLRDGVAITIFHSVSSDFIRSLIY